MTVDGAHDVGEPNYPSGLSHRINGRSDGCDDGLPVLGGPVLAHGLPNVRGIFYRYALPIGAEFPHSPRGVGFGAVASGFGPFSFPPGLCHRWILPATRHA